MLKNYKIISTLFLISSEGELHSDELANKTKFYFGKKATCCIEALFTTGLI